MPDLHQLLRDRFGLTDFRPYQEEVCRAVTEGSSALVVMPTGAGKSLCYQLPGIARGGCALVISPLIALMEDQVAKLREVGVAAERIHSGRDRLTSRAVCRDYLDGELELLFIAPERLSVPGFPEMLTKGSLSLIAVDEAHCISHWGHDFRPDYRLLGERLPQLRTGPEPPPVVALTATATPLVQRDVLEQLAMERAERFIRGFRRENLAVEVVELNPSRRRGAVEALLADPGRRPAIVYAPSRKKTESLAETLDQDYPAAAYHAGMDGGDRDRVQAAFLAGELDVIVATIAFGMGVDKPDVRTVVHTGLPGSLEGYYQEIGRAGRDGEPSRAVLLYSWSDRRTHEFFHDRNYPSPRILERIFEALGPEPLLLSALRARMDLDDEVFDTALEKLVIHGGARVVRVDTEIGPEDAAVRGGNRWRSPYQNQRDHRMDQLERMIAFTDGNGCRMLHLVEHFGDREDSGEPCGVCDVCVPEECEVRRFRAPDDPEARVIAEVLDRLREQEAPTTGQLYKAIPGVPDRRDFERLLDACARAGMIDLVEDSFDKDGQTIRFRRASLTVEGYRAVTDRGPGLDRIQLDDRPRGATPARGRAGRKRARSGGGGASAKIAADADAPIDPALEDKLRQWRLEQARARKVPAYVIFSDKTLQSLAAHRPGDEDQLLEVHGIGPQKAKDFGSQILEIIREG
ncbi:MAG: ATP-dependent DNA helicase RecQ [Acidobacteriota bacterium]